MVKKKTNVAPVPTCLLDTDNKVMKRQVHKMIPDFGECCEGGGRLVRKQCRETSFLWGDQEGRSVNGTLLLRCKRKEGLNP